MRIYVTHLYEGFNERFVTSFIEEVGWGFNERSGLERRYFRICQARITSTFF
jgi:hypothetical protein